MVIDILPFVCSSLRLFVCPSPETRTCRALTDWPSSAGGCTSREWPERCWASQPVPDILMEAGAYRVDHSDHTSLFFYTNPVYDSEPTFSILEL